MPVNAKKSSYNDKVAKCLSKYSKAFLIFADNVRSKQFADIRMALREKDSVILMGKNTLVKRCIKNYIESSGDTKWECLLDLMVGNVGLLFCGADFPEIREVVSKYRLPAPARVGLIAPCAVTIPAGPTGMDPSKTNFFQALNITTKITKGAVEIVSNVEVLKKGDRVGGSQAVLLQMMGVKPFEFGLEIQQVIEDGCVFSPAVLDLTDDDLLKEFQKGLANVTALAMSTSYPALCTVPHHIVNSYKNCVALVLTLESFSFPLADKVKDILNKIASGEYVPEASGGGGGGGGGGAAAAAPAPEPEPEEEEEEEDMGFDLFD